jgi:hypothetical protein
MRQTLLNFALSSLIAIAARAEAPTSFDVGAFKFSRPEAWQWVEVPEGMKMMRKAVLNVPGKEGGKPAEIIFYHFGAGQGGDTQSNVTRWFGQFTDITTPQKSETKDLAGTKATFVSVAGTYQSGMPMGPKTPMAGYALLGAILEDSAVGPVFIKMTGPEAIVKDAAPAFHEFVAAAKK